MTYPHLIYLPYSCYSIWANDTKSLTRNKAIIYIYMYTYVWAVDKITLLLAMDMAKVGGPLLVVKVCLYFHAMCKTL